MSQLARARTLSANGEQSEVAQQVKEGDPRTDQPEERVHSLPRVQPHEPLDAARLSSVLR